MCAHYNCSQGQYLPHGPSSEHFGCAVVSVSDGRDMITSFFFFLALLLVILISAAFWARAGFARLAILGILLIIQYSG